MISAVYIKAILFTCLKLALQFFEILKFQMAHFPLARTFNYISSSISQGMLTDIWQI